MNELALFAGIRGGLLGSTLIRWNTVCAIELDEYNRRVLLQRQRDGMLDKFPIWDDIKTFDGTCWKGKVDIITGGFPCQDISPAGRKCGISGEQSGLWKQFKRVCKEVQPKYIFAENSGRLISSGLDQVLQDISEMGYDAIWAVIPASAVGAPHKRERTYLLAYTNEQRNEGDWWGNWLERWITNYKVLRKDSWKRNSFQNVLWPTEPSMDRVLSYGISNGLDRHYAIGNAQIPRVVKFAWELFITSTY